MVFPSFEFVYPSFELAFGQFFEFVLLEVELLTPLVKFVVVEITGRTTWEDVSKVSFGKFLDLGVLWLMLTCFLTVAFNKLFICESFSAWNQ